MTSAKHRTSCTTFSYYLLKSCSLAQILVAAERSGAGSFAQSAGDFRARGSLSGYLATSVVRSNRPDEVCYIVAYHAGSRLRHDWRLQPEGQLFRCACYDFDAGTLVKTNHSTKTYLRVPINERTQQSQQSGWLNAEDWVRQFLSSEYMKLGRRTIEGVPCEGIETIDPTFGYADPPPTSCVARLWVSVETGYPLRLEYNSTHALTDGDAQVEALFDRFQWDVELSPSLFEPNIPPDYKQRP